MNVLFIAPVDNYTAPNAGYGNASNSLFYILNLLKKEKIIDNLVTVNTNSISQQDAVKCTSINFDMALCVCHPMSFFNKQVLKTFEHLLSTSKNRLLNILWETSPLPTNWNFLWETDLFNGFTAPSDFLFELIKQKTNKPVYKLPYYININLYKKIKIEDKLDENIFNVFIIGQSTTRKGIEDGVIAFSRSLGHFEDCKLNIKLHHLNQMDSDMIKGFNKLVKSNCVSFKSAISLCQDTLKQKEIITLYKNSSLLLFCSRGEGFGLPAVEASSMGIPVLYTDWSAIKETAKMAGNEAIKCYEDSAQGMTHHGYEIGSIYGVPLINHMEFLLMEKYKLWKRSKEDYYSITNNNNKVIDERYGKNAIKNYFIEIFTLLNKKENKLCLVK